MEKELFTILEDAAKSADVTGIISGSIMREYIPLCVRCNVTIGMAPGSNEGGYLHVIIEQLGTGEMIRVMLFRHQEAFTSPKLSPIIDALYAALVKYFE